MKTMNVRLLTVILAVFTLVFVPSCKDDDNAVSPNKPVLNSNFFYVKSDANTVVFNSTIPASSTWITNVATGVSTDFVDDTCKMFIPIMGDYTFTCSALVDGVEYVSDQFSFNIPSTNTTFLESGIWKSLTGGPTGHKVWKLDTKPVVAISIGDDGIQKSVTSYTSSFFHKPLDFYGDAQAGGALDNVWGPWGGFTVEDPEGSISFDGTTGIVTLNLTDGVNADGDTHVTDSIDASDATKHIYKAHPTARKGTFTGAFSMTVAPRDPNFVTLTANNGGGTLWANMLAGQYKYLKTLSAQTGKLTFSGDLRFPIDKKRIGENQFETTNLKNVMVVHCSDSALVIRVKRTYDGFSSATAKKASSCWLLYNFIVDGYNYGGAVSTPLYNTAVVNASTTAASIAGTWKCDSLTGEWVNWGTKNTYGSYTAATEASTFASWGATNSAEKYTAALKSRVTFNANGTAVISNVKYNATSGLEETATVNTTYTVNNGYITFGASVEITAFAGMLNLSGKNVYVISTPANGKVGSLWLGQNNGTKEESTAVQLIKVQ